MFQALSTAPLTMRHLIFFLPFLLLILDGAAATSFISPQYQTTATHNRFDGNSVWELGSTQVVAFDTAFEAYRLEFWQQNPDDTASLSRSIVYSQADGAHLPQSFQWTVQTYEFNLSDSPIFFFWLRDELSDNQQTSSYFNITVAAAASSSLSSKTAGPTSTAATVSSSSSPTATGTETPTSQPITTKSNDGRLPLGATIGIAIGVALGVILLAAIGMFVFLKKRKQKMQQQQHERHQNQDILLEQKSTYQGYEPMASTLTPPVELSMSMRATELMENGHYDTTRVEMPANSPVNGFR